MSEGTKQIIEHIRGQIIANVFVGPMPPPEEMPLLSLEYQNVWRSEDEEPGDATWRALLDEPGKPSTAAATPEEHAFDQKTAQLHRQKRWAESEQLATLARMEKLLAGDERCEQDVVGNNRQLSQQIEILGEKCAKAPTPIHAAAARRRLLECQKARRANLRKLAELKRTREKVLSATRRNAVEYLGMVKRLEARKEYRKLSHEKRRATRGGLGFLGTLGAILAINDFQKMAHGIDKLAKKK